MNCTIIGRGAWGRAVGSILEENGATVNYLEKEHSSWLPGTPGSFVFLALPCQLLRDRLTSLPSPQVPVVSLIKGLEVDRFLRVSEIVQAQWPDCPVACVSGPSFALEVEKRDPTAVVVATLKVELGKEIQSLLRHPRFRPYRSTDLAGVELGGALKNIYALAGGLSQGLGIGENGRAALMTRSLAEMTRIIVSLGGQPDTVFGLSGVGDLMLTAFSGSSRNFQVGEAVARGQALDEVLSGLQGTAEGVSSVKAVHQWVVQNDIKAPIVEEIYAIFYEKKSPAKSINDLMLRTTGEE